MAWRKVEPMPNESPTRSARSEFVTGSLQLANRAAQGDPKAIRELIHWTRAFGDTNPLGPALIFNIRFRDPKHRPAVDNKPDQEGSEKRE
jgi:hypothetical protein